MCELSVPHSIVQEEDWNVSNFIHWGLKRDPYLESESGCLWAFFFQLANARQSIWFSRFCLLIVCYILKSFEASIRIAAWIVSFDGVMILDIVIQLHCAYGIDFLLCIVGCIFLLSSTSWLFTCLFMLHMWSTYFVWLARCFMSISTVLHGYLLHACPCCRWDSLVLRSWQCFLVDLYCSFGV